MKVLIVLAHPEKASLTASLARVAKDQFEKQGDEVQLTDLYAQNWKSAIDIDDFPHYDKSEKFNVILGSKQAYEENAYSEDVKKEHEKLFWADALVFVFPFWWFSMPAILRGWVERVFSYGIGYGRYDDDKKHVRYGDGLFKGKRAILITGIGGKGNTYSGRSVSGPIEDLLFPINHGIFFYAGYQALPPFVVFDSNFVDKNRFKAIESSLRERIATFESTKPIAYRSQNGGDYTIPQLQLKEELAPGKEGFKIHISD
ncbi:hypothetical protein ZYGR_0AI07820 [Zygosaccharomyces rouxii]|uniref:Flavodoxin-like fold domain-containing protein n=1 Tax=Zygosaccharomyces rouxii TaxID=4956 RepID=A0A1Q3ACW0_ZYGRO|nr:hypothetical protein ZYGR_0AI07820 [Zygosaccharomyces rouxii]